MAVDLRRWVRELRTLVVTVVPPALQEQGLATALDDLAATLRSGGLEVELDVADIAGLPPEVESLAYRVAQEAARNAVRHAGAERVRISLSCSGTDLVMLVQDDGRGYDPQARPRRTGSVGLELLTRLVAAQGGTVEASSVPGRGALVRPMVPVGAAATLVPAPADA